MSGPWEQYAKQPVPQAAPAAAPEPEFEQPPVEDFASPQEEVLEPPTLMPENERVSQLDAAVANTPLNAAANPDELRQGLTMLVDQGVTGEGIRDYITRSGFAVSDQLNGWLDMRDAKEAEASASDDIRNDAAIADGPEGEDMVGTIIGWDIPEKVMQSVGEPVGVGDSAWSGLQSGAMFGFDDEWKAGWGALGNKAGNLLGMNETDASLGDVYEILKDKYRREKDEAYNANPIAYGAGFVPGMVLTAPLAAGRGVQAETALGRAGQAARIGAGEGAMSGMGNAEGGLVDRTLGAAKGGALGGLAGSALSPVGSTVGSIYERLVTRAGPRNPRNALTTGLDAMTRTAPQNADDIAARIAAYEEAGVPWRLMDVIDESGRGVVRTAAGKMTPAREELARAADQVYTGAQERVAGQARKHISDAPETAKQLGHRVAEEQAAMGPRFDAVRNEPLNATPEMLRAFSTSEGRSVMRAIGRYMTPDEQAKLNAFTKAVASVTKNVDPRLPPAIQEQITRQLMEGSPLTVDIADKFARVITERAKDSPAMARVAKDYAETIRGAARQQYPVYDDALNEFAARAGVGNAAAGTRNFEGSDYLTAQPDEFARIVDQASPTPQAAATPDGGMTRSEADALRMRARDDVVNRATSGSGAGAVGVARQVASGGAQGQRTRALIGEEAAGGLERGMAKEVERVKNTAYVDPRTGSQTAGRQADDDAVDNVVNLVMDASTAGKSGIIRQATKWMKEAGLRNVDAERLVREAISEDPVKNKAAVEYLVSRGVSQERARGLVRALSAASAGRASGAFVGTEERPDPLNSVRAIIKQGN